MEEKGFKMMDVFFAFLRNALWDSEEELPKELTDRQTDNLLLAARQHALTALVVDAMMRNEVKMPKQMVLELFGITNRIRHANQQLNEELKRFVSLPLRDYVVVKGQTVAALYPSPSLRMSGDIDFLVADYQEACAILKREWNIDLPKRLIDKEASFKHGGCTYEIHSLLVEFGRRKHQRYWNALMKRPHSSVEVDGAKVPTLEPTVYAVYIFVHLFFHFIREGVGLRQMCDWAMVLRHYREEINQDELQTMLRSLGLIRAYRVFGNILVERIGMTDFPLTITEEDRKWSEKVLKDILIGGNFGNNLKEQGIHGWRAKMRTMRYTMCNCWRYYRLAPTELLMKLPSLAWLNVKLIVNS